MVQVFKRIGVPLVALAFMVAAFVGMTPKANAEYYCGSQCNGQSPSWVIPSNGVQCKNSETQIASGHPSASYDQYQGHSTYAYVTESDSLITVKVMYSTVCQTMWAVVTNSHGGVPANCSLSDVRTASPTWSAKYSCPGVGTTRTYAMVDDYVSTHTVAAHVSFTETLNRAVCTSPGANGNCLTVDTSYPVTFSYYKSY